MEMKPSRSPGTCPRCGAGLSLDLDDLQGLCPRCVSTRLFDGPNEPELDLIRAEPAFRRIGKFELLEELARGGMGVVYRARHVGLDRTVAVKLLGDAHLASPHLVERFQAEAAAAARLRHPRIVAIHEFGVEDGQHYFAMDLVDGLNLAEATAAGPLPPHRAAQLTALVAEAVQHAHERGLIHRDLKPSNVILDSAGLPHVTDFGLARPLDETSSLTATGQVLGTPGYMAPEQVETRGLVGPATDVYGLGSLLYHLLTGRPPFVGSGLPSILAQVSQSEPASPRLLNPAVPEDVAAVCLKCLQKRPADRYPSADRLRQDLERFLRGEPTLVRPTGMLGRLARWRRRQPALAAAVGALGLVLVLGLAGVTWQWQKAQRSLVQIQLLAARGRRQSGEIGQKHEALQLIAAAARARPSAALRMEAVAALAKLDLTPHAEEWVAQPGLEFMVTPPTYALSLTGGSLANWQLRGPDDNVVRIDAVDGRGSLLQLDYEGRAGDELAFSNNGHFLAVRYYRDSEVGVWEVARRTLLWRKAIPKDADFTLEFSPDSVRLAVVSAQRTVRLFQVSDGREAGPVQPGELKGPIQRARFSPDGQRLAIVAGPEMVIWDLPAQKLVSRELFSDWPTAAVAWHPDSRRIAVALWQRPDVFVCDAQYPPGRQFINSGGSLVFQLMFSPTGDLLVGRTADGRTRFWEAATWQPILTTETGLASRFLETGEDLAFDRNTGSVGIWTLDRSRVLRAFGGQSAPQPLAAPAFSPDGRFVFWCAQLGICRADLASGRTEDVFSPGVLALEVRPRDGLLLTAGASGLQTRPWRGNPSVLAEESLIGLGSDAARTTIVGLASDHLLLVGATVRSLPLGNLQEPVSLAVDPQARWAFVGTAASGGGVLDLTDGRIVCAIAENKCQAAFDQTGARLALASARHYSILSTANWAPLRTWGREAIGSKSAPGSNPVAISPDGRTLAAALTSRAISLLDLETGAERVRLEAPVSLVIGSLAFSLDARQLAAASAMGAIQVWELQTLRAELTRLGLDWK